MIAQLFTFTAGVSAEFNQIISKVEKCLGWEELPSTHSPIREFAASPVPSLLGEGWVGEEAVALALYCFLRNTDSYEKVVIRGANTNGDSDSIACIAGSISGAYLGIDAIPPEWVRKIEKSPYLEDLAQRLAAKKEAVTLREGEAE
jgi:ADP-ribosylglycohydrolase